MKNQWSTLVKCGVAALLVGGFACKQQNQATIDTPSRGTLRVAADASFQPLVYELTAAYTGLNPEANFDIRYIPEQEAILTFLQDSVGVVFVTRPLSEKEQTVIDQQKGIYKEQHIATDGIALIVSRQNSDSLFTMNELKSIFEKKVKNWEQLPNKTTKGPITLVFDDANSSNINFVLNKLGVDDLTNLSIYTSGSNEKVVEFIRENPTAIGFIGMSWISDEHVKKTHELSSGIRVIGISSSEKPTSVDEYYQPFLRHLVDEKYPLSRPLYILSREGQSGLGSGLQTYIARDIGSLIIEKKGLVPTIPYPRTVELRADNLKN